MEVGCWADERIDSEMPHMATKPFAQPTASSLGESQVRLVQIVVGGIDEKDAFS